MDINEVVRTHAPSMMQTPGVVGVAVTEQDGAPCILVMFADQAVLDRSALPDRLEGFPVTARVTGEFKALDGDD